MTLCAGPYSAYISTDLRRSFCSLYTYRLPVVYIPFFCRLKPMGFSSGAIGFRFASSQNTDMIPFWRYKRLFCWLFFFLFFVLFLKDYKWELFLSLCVGSRWLKRVWNLCCECLSPGYSICIICELRRWRMESSHCFCIDDVIRFCLFPAQKKTEKKRKLDLSFWHIYQQFTER